MKTIKLFYILLFAFATSLLSCEEDQKTVKKDSTIPNSVSEVTATSLPGGAKISYTLPKDNDLLYVKAVYTLQNGNTAEVKSSLYQNYLEVVGFGDTEEHEVKLYCVDRSEQESLPVSVMITPLKPSVLKIGESIKLRDDFGGVNVTFTNEDKAPVAILVFSPDEFGEFVQVEAKYTSVSSGTFSVRGFDTLAREFRVQVRDRHDNYSAPVSAMIKPLFEEPIKKQNFSAVYLTHDFKADNVFSNWTITKLWDGLLGGQGVHTAQGGTDPNPPYLDEYPSGDNAMFTFNLGVTARLSRFKLYQRGSVDQAQANSWGYKHGNPKFFDMWGYTPVPGALTPPADGKLTNWTKLLSNVEVVKPSGLPLGTNSNEDLAVLFAGHEFVFPLDAPPVQYIRFVCNQNYSGTKFVHFMEVDFWGQIKK